MPAPEVEDDVMRRREEVPAVRPHARRHAALLPEEEEGQMRIVGHLLHDQPTRDFSGFSLHSHAHTRER